MVAIALTLILLPILTLGHQQDLSAQELWSFQMDQVQKIVEEYGLAKEEPNKDNLRQAGTGFFDIGFVDTPSDGLTVHTLRPRDVDVIAAMGDSITAGTGAEGETPADLAIEYRSVCFSVGGNATLEESITLPNILKKFNHRIVGYSYENGPRVNQYPFGFNVAVPGARAYNMYNQAVDLIDRLQTDDRSKFNDDWKVVTLFIGGNDLCAIGRDPEGTTPEVYVAEIKRALDLLHENVPRMLVNIVDILEIYLLPQVGNGYGSTAVCRQLQSTFCGYVVDTAAGNATEQERLKAINKEYQVQLKELIDSGVYDTTDDFTVVIQPFLRDSVLPYTEDGQVDATYFAPDCFHFSDIGHAMGAINLWNNMLEPVGKKSTVWSITDLKVPTTEHPYIYTSKNSIPPTSSPDPPAEEPEETGTEAWLIVVIVFLAICVVIEAVVLYAINKKKRKH